MRIAIALIASLVISAACSDSNGPAKHSPLASVKILSGAGQTGQEGHALPDSIVLVATDSNGQPAYNDNVIWGPSGLGHTEQGSVFTNKNGRAATSWILNTAAGADTLSVAVIDNQNQNDVVQATVYATATGP